MAKLALLLGFAILSSRAGSIDQGSWVRSPPFFVSDSTTVQFRLTSTDGGFGVAGSNILGGGNIFCFHDLGYCPPGAYTFQTFFAVSDSFPAQAFGLGGSLFGPVLLGCPAPACPHTSVSLLAQPVVISGPGDYAVAFSASGQIQASPDPPGVPFVPGTLALDQTLMGYGVLHFSVYSAGPGLNYFALSGAPGQELEFDFTPEPATIFPGVLALAAIWRLRPLSRKG